MNKELKNRYAMVFIEPCTFFASAISACLEEFRARLVILETYASLREPIRLGSLNPLCCALLINEDCLNDESSVAYLKVIRESNPKHQIMVLSINNSRKFDSLMKPKLIDHFFDKELPFNTLVASITAYLDKVPSVCTYNNEENVVLTPDQEVVFQLLAQGNPLKCIADACSVSLSSIEKMLRCMRIAHGASSNPQLIRIIMKKRQRGGFEF